MVHYVRMKVYSISVESYWFTEYIRTEMGKISNYSIAKGSSKFCKINFSGWVLSYFNSALEHLYSSLVHFRILISV